MLQSKYMVALIAGVLLACGFIIYQNHFVRSFIYKLETTKRAPVCDTPLRVAVDSIYVIKHTRRMYVYNNRKLAKVYTIALGTCPVGAKHRRDDGKTPEGHYQIDGKNPASMGHKSLGISYPNRYDRQYAKKEGWDTGGDIKIHGTVNGWETREAALRKTDWTWGCIAVTNKEIDELYAHVAIGTKINIVP